jgi:hypothetical protein
MSLMPAFEIGVWNVWILVLALLSAAFVPFVVNGEQPKREWKKSAFCWRSTVIPTNAIWIARHGGSDSRQVAVAAA